jgi:hypothetical protein
MELKGGRVALIHPDAILGDFWDMAAGEVAEGEVEPTPGQKADMAASEIARGRYAERFDERIVSRSGRYSGGARTGLYKPVSEETKAEIRRRMAEGAVQQHLAREYGIGHKRIAAICGRKYGRNRDDLSSPYKVYHNEASLPKPENGGKA